MYELCAPLMTYLYSTAAAWNSRLAVPASLCATSTHFDGIICIIKPLIAVNVNSEPMCL